MSGKITALVLCFLSFCWALHYSVTVAAPWGLPRWTQLVVCAVCWMGAAVHIWRGRAA